MNWHEGKTLRYCIGREENYQVDKVEMMYSNTHPKEVGLSVNTISNYIKDIGSIKYVGCGENGYWEIDE